MINIYRNSKIYIFCPSQHVTGGTELAHQLVDYLIKKEKETYIVYIKDNEIVQSEVPIEFNKYNIKKASEVIDSNNNILILPEVYFSMSKFFTNIQFVFWWMSVDNFFYKSNFIEYFKFFNIYNILKIMYSRYINNISLFDGFSLSDLKRLKNNSIHVYQSTYAKHFLLDNNITEILPLSDYINEEYTANNNSIEFKRDIILYNRSKGYSVTKKIIRKLPSYKFIALSNFSRTELSELFSQSKIYIDFGNHPGKDRLPREAVMRNCCVIVGHRGSARYFEDIPILNKYKINENDLNKIAEAINYCLKNYIKSNEDFDFYRNRVLNEKLIFYKELNELFNIK